MGMFDTIHARIICPHCGNKIKIEEQIKWSECLLKDYNVGSKIEAADGIYDWATYVRPELKEECVFCGKTVHYEVEIMNGIVLDIRAKEKKYDN